MASNPKMEYQIFLCIFQKKSAMATLGLKEMGNFFWEGREKSLPNWLFQFSCAKLRQPTGQTFFPNFPKEFSHFLQAIAEFFWKIQRKTWYSNLGLDAMPLSLKNLLLTNVACPCATKSRKEIKWSLLKSLTSESTPSATQFYKRSYKISHNPGL